MQSEKSIAEFIDLSYFLSDCLLHAQARSQPFNSKLSARRSLDLLEIKVTASLLFLNHYY